MEITNVLIAGGLAVDFERLLPQTQSKNYKFVSDGFVTQELIDWAEAYVAFGPQPDLNFTHLKWIHSLGAGVDSFVTRTLGEDTLLTRTAGSFGEKIAEYCLSYVLRDFQAQDYFTQRQESRDWSPMPPKQLRDATILVFGTGAIGSKVAEVFSSFGSSVYGVSRSGRQKSNFKQVYPLDALYNEGSRQGSRQTHGSSEAVTQGDNSVHYKDTGLNGGNGDRPQSGDGEIGSCLRTADWVICTLPLTADTLTLFDRRLLSRFQKAKFINVGRGKLVQEADLLEALNHGNLTQCVLDVFAQEPLSPASPLWKHPGITVTPHISALTDAKEAVDCFVDTLKSIEEGNYRLLNRVDLKRGY